jgi:hypothetical protein
MLRALVSTARSRWQTCQFDDLLHVATETAREVGLHPEWTPALAAVLAEDARGYLADHHCPIGVFASRVEAWGEEQAGDIQAWLGRQAREK